MVSSALYTSKTVEWETPQKLFDELNQEFHFNLDPCCTEKKCKMRKIFYQVRKRIKSGLARIQSFSVINPMVEKKQLNG